MKRRRKRRKIVESASSQSDIDMTITQNNDHGLDSKRLSQLDIASVDDDTNRSTQDSSPSLPVSDGDSNQRVVRKSKRLSTKRMKQCLKSGEWKCSRCTFVNQQDSARTHCAMCETPRYQTPNAIDPDGDSTMMTNTVINTDPLPPSNSNTTKSSLTAQISVVDLMSDSDHQPSPSPPPIIEMKKKKEKRKSPRKTKKSTVKKKKEQPKISNFFGNRSRSKYYARKRRESQSPIKESTSPIITRQKSSKSRTSPPAESKSTAKTTSKPSKSCKSSNSMTSKSKSSKSMKLKTSKSKTAKSLKVRAKPSVDDISEYDSDCIIMSDPLKSIKTRSKPNLKGEISTESQQNLQTQQWIDKYAPKKVNGTHSIHIPLPIFTIFSSTFSL